MTAVDKVHYSLNNMEVLGERPFLITDADHTLFRPGSTDLYPDAAAMLERIDPTVTALVTANPDRILAAERAKIIQADIVVTSAHKQWPKYGLFRLALAKAEAEADFDLVTILGDRWVMDVAVAKFVMWRAGHDRHAAYIRREGEKSLSPLVDNVLASAEHAGYRLLRVLHATHSVRPDVVADNKAA